MSFGFDRQSVISGSGGGVGTAPAQAEILISPSVINFPVVQGSTQRLFSITYIYNIAAGTFANPILGTPSLGYVSATLVFIQDGIYRLDVELDPTGLTAGSFTGTIAFSDSNASNTTQSVTINVIVTAVSTPPAIMRLGSSTSQLLSMTVGGNHTSPLTDSTNIFNDGGANALPLAGPTVFGITYSSGANLITASVTNGVLTVTGNGVGLSSIIVADYVATVEVRDANAASAVFYSVLISVVAVPATPEIFFNPPSPFSAVQGASNPTPQAVAITNSGTGTLATCSAGTVVYTGAQTGWLGTGFAGGGNSQSLTLTPNITGLTPENLVATFPINSSGASNTGVLVSVNLTISALAATLVLTPAGPGTFSCPEGGPNPTNQVLNITNGGGGTLATCTFSTPSYSGGGGGWLTVTQGGSGNAQTATLSVNVGSRAQGTRQATFNVLSGSLSLGVGVTFVVTAPVPPPVPTISLNPAAPQGFLSIVGQASPAPQTITISNSGNGTLAQCSNSTPFWTGGDNGWLTIQFSGNGNGQAMQLTAANGSMAAGSRRVDFNVLSSGASNTGLAVVVTFDLGAAAPTIVLTPFGPYSFSTPQGGSDPAPQTLTITNSGGGTLATCVATTPTYGGGGTGWLTDPITGAGNSQQIVLQPVVGALTQGTRTADFVLNSAGATNDGIGIAVTFTVTAPVAAPAISITPPNAFNATVGTSSPANQTVGIVNAGGGTLALCTSGSITYGGGSPGWLTTLSFAPGGGGNTQQMTVGVTLGSLTVGTRTAQFVVSSAGASNTVTITITFNVTAVGSQIWDPPDFNQPDWTTYNTTTGESVGEPFDAPPLAYFTGTVRTYNSAATFQSALNAAVAKDIIRRTGSFTSTGRTLFPKRPPATALTEWSGTPGVDWVLLDTSDHVAIEALNRQVVPADIVGTPIESSNYSTYTWTVEQGAGGYYCLGAHIKNVFDSKAVHQDRDGLIEIAGYVGSTRQQTQLAHQPGYFVFDRMIVDGNWQEQTSGGCKRAIVYQGKGMQVLRCQMRDIASQAGLDTSAIGGWNGQGDWYIFETELMSACEGILVGGSATSMGNIPGGYQRNIFFKRCFFSKNPLWEFSTNNIAFKNLFENKNGANILLESCVLNDHVANGGQDKDIVLKVAALNDTEGAWTQSENITLRNCKIIAGWGKSDCTAIPSTHKVPPITGPATDIPSIKQPNRFQFDNCLWVRSRANASNQSSTSNVEVTLKTYSVYNVHFKNCSFDMYNSMIVFGNWSPQTPRAAGLQIVDCLFYVPMSASFIRDSVGTTNSGSLNKFCGTDWYVRGNLVYKPGGQNGDQSGFDSVLCTGQFRNYASTTPIALANLAADDTTVTDSRFTTMSTKGGPPGCNIPRLKAAISGVGGEP